MVACLFLYAAAAPHSIAGTQTAWLLGMTLWATRFLVRPRPRLFRTPVDTWLLGFFVITFLTSLASYNPEVSIGKLRAASLFTVVYLVSQNVRDRRTLRALVLVLVASCGLGLVHTFGRLALGRGVKVRALAAGGPLRAAGVEEGDTILSVDGTPVGSPEEVEAAVRVERPSKVKEYRSPEGKRQCVWDAAAACVLVYRHEFLPTYRLARDGLAPGDTAAARLGMTDWSRGRDERATGFYGQYQTYSEVLQLVASLALGLLLSLRRRLSLKGALLALALTGFVAALILTVTRASWAGLLLSSVVIVLVGASRRTLLVTAGLALPLVVAGLFVLQQRRQVGFIDTQEGSTSWRLMVWRDGSRILFSKPRHMLVGVGMDSLKRRWREWGMFDQGRSRGGTCTRRPCR